MNALPLLSDCEKRKIICTIATLTALKRTSYAISDLSKVAEESFPLDANHMPPNNISGPHLCNPSTTILLPFQCIVQQETSIWIVDRMMIKDTFYQDSDNYRASVALGTNERKCSSHGFHPVNEVRVGFFRQMCLTIRTRIKAETVHAKLKSASAAPIVRTKIMTAHEAESANREKVAQWCNKIYRLFVGDGSSGPRKITEVTSQFAKRTVGTISMRNNDDLGMLVTLFNAFQAFQGNGTASVTRRKLSK